MKDVCVGDTLVTVSLYIHASRKWAKSCAEYGTDKDVVENVSGSRIIFVALNIFSFYKKLQDCSKQESGTMTRKPSANNNVLHRTVGKMNRITLLLLD